jgi:hypothetical protein
VSPFFCFNKSVVRFVEYPVIFATFALSFKLELKQMKNRIELKMVDSYRFTSDEEPTDEQLGQLMKEVAIDVRKRAEIANKKFQEELRQLCILKAKQPLAR